MTHHSFSTIRYVDADQDVSQAVGPRLCAVHPAYFTPYRPSSSARARGCLTCAHFLGRFYAEHLLCERNDGRQVIGRPAMGCAFWEREPGSDDE